MDEANNRRCEDRLTYLWPIWFSEDFSQRASQGLMTDISPGGVAFTYSLEGESLREGQSLRISLSIPRLDDEDPASTVTITQAGRVCRAETLPDGRGRAALRFDQPLDLGPAEQAAFEILSADREASLVVHRSKTRL
ncbi:MAG: PilZ domain-containing protein [Sedimentisphaerales bacterium]|nr:PilZ domain-containing protein [Sedimentisphaerales bacterium]